MASPAPAKSQPLHNFPLPSLWSKNHPRPRRPSKPSITRLDSPSIITDPTVQNPPPVSDHTKNREEREGEEREGGESEEELAKMWNLRPRKQLVIKKRSGSRNGLAEEKRVSDGEVKKEKRERFSISLSRIEIEEDFFAMTGSKPSRRPKKRNKSVQKQLDDIFPGMWLDSITPDSYKVNEAPDKP